MVSFPAEPLVSRARELAVLDQVVAGVQQRHGEVVLVHGEPGIGKSALARAFAARCEQAALAIGWGSAWEAGGAPPLWPWLEALRPLCAAASDATLDALPQLEVVLELMPELRRRFEDRPRAAPLDPAATRFRTLSALCELLEALAARAPVAIVLDDVHAADPASLQLLGFVAPRLRSVAAAVLATHRDAEVRLSPGVAEPLAQARRHARVLAPARLDRAAIRELVTSSRIDADESTLESVARLSEGNPLFVVEAVRLLASGARASEGDGGRAVLQQRISQLPPACRDALAIAALVGREFPRSLVAAAAGLSPDALDAALAPAESADVLTEVAPGSLRFTHVLLRDALERTLAPARRTAMHLAIAEALERSTATDARTRAVGLATHFTAAIPLAEPTRAVAHAIAAAERALELAAHEDALALLERLLAVLDAHAVDASARIDVMVALGRAYIRGGVPERGRAVCRDAAALARLRGDAARLAAAALAWGEHFAFAVVDAELVALLQEALAMLGETASPLRARVLARLAAALQPAPDPLQPMALAREAIALVREVGDPSTRLAVLVAAGSALIYFADPRERRRINAETVELATVLGDPVRRARGELRLVFDALELGDTAAADAHLERHAAIAASLPLPALRAQSLLLRAMRATSRGAFEAAQRHLAQAQATLGDRGDSNSDLARAAMQAGLACARADAAALEACADEVVAVVSRYADRAYARALQLVLTARRGQLAQARAQLDGLMSELDLFATRPFVCWLGEACVATGAREHARELLACLEPFADRIHSWGIGLMVTEAPHTEIMGGLARLLGRHDDAVAWLHDAARRCEAADARPHLARIMVALAAALLERGGPDDVEAAQRQRTRARSLAEVLDLPGVREACDAIATAPPPRAAPSLSQPPALRPRLQREGETWLVHAGERSHRLKDSRGVQMLAELLARPTEALHVLELHGDVDTGDAGPVLDAVAIADYRRALVQLRDEQEDAESIGDLARAEQLRARLEAVAQELAAGVGLGGRIRRDRAAIERARVNVRRRLADAIGRIAALDPELGAHLDWAVKTGIFCSYQPNGRSRLRPSPRGSG
ncbi:MAG: AAA family ATPase [Nannocystaceae bacterium]|nr:AAA family ATPase [Nannocystaceae bacterium]